MNPEISVIIPTYNRVNLLVRTVQSVLDQSFSSFEIIVVDDGSADKTKQMMNRLCNEDDRVRYYYQENSGRSAARNLGIKNAAGEWLLFLDSDDILVSDALSFLAGKTRDYPQAGMISGTFLVMDENENLIDMTGYGKKHNPYEGIVDEPYLNMIRKFYLPMGSYIVHHDIVAAGGNFDSSLEPCEDYDFCLRMAKKGELACFKKPVASFRKHGDNTPLDIFYAGNVKMAYKHLNEINGDASIKNKKPIIAEWKSFLADNSFNYNKFRNAFYNYILSAAYSPNKVLSKNFYKQVFSCLLPVALKNKLKVFSSRNGE